MGTGGVNTANAGTTTLATTVAGKDIAVGGNSVGNTTGNTVLTATGAITGGLGVVSGNNVTLDAATGVGVLAARVKTAATTKNRKANRGSDV